MTEIAVVVPVYRNGPTLPELAARLDAALTGRTWSLHLVVDACPDGSADVARRLAADPRITATVLPANVGQHRALAAGLARADGDVWVCLDGDLQDPPEAVPPLVDALLEARVDGVFAGRRGRYESAGRRLTGSLHRRAMHALTGLPPDAGAFLALDRPLRDAVVDAVTRGCPSVVAAAGASGLPLTSVPVARDVRRIGNSAWTSAARRRQAVATLAWSANHRSQHLTTPAQPKTTSSRYASDGVSARWGRR